MEDPRRILAPLFISLMIFFALHQQHHQDTIGIIIGTQALVKFHLQPRELLVPQLQQVEHLVSQLTLLIRPIWDIRVVRTDSFLRMR